ncbi:MAG: hypothetical protein Q7T03_07625 [Deltaproteobacteria bacterium]|nr:hypothetical protein [Deltaproteobacteria bacterium]
MKQLRRIFLVMVLGLTLTMLVAGCAGRLPSNSKSTSLIRKYFNKYAKKYPESTFGAKKVANVEILSTDEIHKHLVSVLAFVTMSSDVHKVRVSIEKGPFGWRYVDWENLSSAEDQPASPEQ